MAGVLLSVRTGLAADGLPEVGPAEVDGRAFDLVVVGGTPGGIACAVRAAREGLHVLLVNHTRHLGGFMTSGAGGWEAPYDGLRSPLYAEIRTAATDYYRTTYGDGSPQHRASLPDPKSNAHIDRPKIEPRIAEMLFNRMIAGEKRLSVLLGFYAVDAQRDGALLKSVELRQMHGDRTCRVRAKVFADGMYEGDLAAVAKVAWRVGREARAEYKEPHAGVIHTKPLHKAAGQRGFPKDADQGRLKIRSNSHATGELVAPESTGEADHAVMAYNYRLILTKDPANRVPVPKPERLERGDFRGTLSRSIVPNLPNNKIAWNGGGRLVGPQNGYSEADWPTRERIARKYLDAALAALWLVQNDPAVPAAERDFWRDFGLAKDEFPDNGHVPYEVYVREARRIVGRHVFTEHDGVLAQGIGRTPIHADSVAMTDWPLDSVACTPRKARGGNLDGIFFLAEESRPAQVPYRCLLPVGVDNLLVPVALSASHVGWGCIRLEPVWMQTGEAAGFAAALAVKGETTPGQLDAELLCRTLVEKRMMVSFFNDVDVTSAAPWTAAVEYFGARGCFASYDARPSAPLTGPVADCWAETFGKVASQVAFDATAQAKKLAPVETQQGQAVSAAEFAARLKGVLPADRRAAVDEAATKLNLAANAPLSRGDACRLMFALVAPRCATPVKNQPK